MSLLRVPLVAGMTPSLTATGREDLLGTLRLLVALHPLTLFRKQHRWIHRLHLRGSHCREQQSEEARGLAGSARWATAASFSLARTRWRA